MSCTGGEVLALRPGPAPDFATQDLQREQDQRIFLRALLSKMTSPGVFLNPFKALPGRQRCREHADGGRGHEPLSAVRGRRRRCATRRRLRCRLPRAPTHPTSAGDAVLWDSAQAKELFNDLQTGQTVPKSLITGSQQGT